MSAVGTIEAEVFRTEQIELPVRTSDPQQPSTSEMWIRVDITPGVGGDSVVFGIVRIQGHNGANDIPIIDINDETKLGSNVYVGPKIYFGEYDRNRILDTSAVGFLPVAESNASIGSPRIVMPNGNIYKAHDSLTVDTGSAIPDSVVTQYQFEDDSDTTTTTDAVGSNNGFIMGGSFDSDARCGSFAYRSDGSDDRVVSTSAIDLSASGDNVGASVGGFFNPDNATDFQATVYWGADSNNYVRVDINNDEWRAVTQVNEVNFTVVSSSGVSTSGFTHVLACHDGSDIYLIIDGTEVARTSTAADVTQIGAGDLVVADGGLNFSGYAGLTDNASWANKALTESEAQALIDQC